MADGFYQAAVPWTAMAVNVAVHRDFLLPNLTRDPDVYIQFSEYMHERLQLHGKRISCDVHSDQ